MVTLREVSASTAGPTGRTAVWGVGTLLWLQVFIVSYKALWETRQCKVSCTTIQRHWRAKKSSELGVLSNVCHDRDQDRQPPTRPTRANARRACGTGNQQTRSSRDFVDTFKVLDAGPPLTQLSFPPPTTSLPDFLLVQGMSWVAELKYLVMYTDSKSLGNPKWPPRYATVVEPRCDCPVLKRVFCSPLLLHPRLPPLQLRRRLLRLSPRRKPSRPRLLVPMAKRRSVRRLARRRGARTCTRVRAMIWRCSGWTLMRMVGPCSA